MALATQTDSPGPTIRINQRGFLYKVLGIKYCTQNEKVDIAGQNFKWPGLPAAHAMKP